MILFTTLLSEPCLKGLHKLRKTAISELLSFYHRVNGAYKSILHNKIVLKAAISFWEQKCNALNLNSTNYSGDNFYL